ncbi:hypothetical protein MBLNU13_g04222t1 [Cladosporium sp. NU13]
MSAFVGSPARSHLWFAIGAGEVVDGQKESSEAKTLRKRLLAGPTVDIFVGAERRHWTLHRNLLCHHSSYFETEFVGHEVPKKRKGEDNANELELPDDDPRGFELLVKWLYQGSLEDVSGMTDMEKYDHAVACNKLYVLCDKFDMVQLKNIAMDRYRRQLNEAQLVPDPDEINEIYRAASARSPFRRLMTNIAARQIMDPEVDKDAESYRKCFESNPDFAVEMINSIRALSGGVLFNDPTEGDACDYHDHSNGQKCHTKGKARGMMRRVMSVDIRKQPREPRTPRKLRINPPSPEATRDTSRSQANGSGPGTSTGSPESTRTSGFAIPTKDLASAKEASRRMNILADAISPRKLPDDRFNSIVRRLNYASITNGTNGTHSREEQSVAGASDVSRPAPKKQPRKLSVNHSAERMNGVVADGG